MSIRMRLLRKSMKLSKKSDINAVAKKGDQDLKSVVVNKDFFREVNEFLERLVLGGTYHEIVEIGGVKCHKLEVNPKKKYYKKTKPNENKILLYIHGGGFCRGFPLHGTFYMKAMMKRLGCKAIAVDYSLSPECIYPTALNEIVSVYKGLLEQYAPDDIIVTGESAGGNFVLALLMYLRDNNLPLPSCGIMLSPYLNLRNDTPSYEINKSTDVCLTKEILDLMAMSYIKGDYCEIPNPLCEEGYVSPVLLNFDGLPPLMFCVCSDEMLYEDTALAYYKAKTKNIKCKLYTDKKCFHAYVVMGDTTPESRKACNEIAKFVTSLEKD